MSPPDSPASIDQVSARVSFERLRERTDELELLISGLSMVALFALPGWLIDAHDAWQHHLPLAVLSAAAMLVPMLVLCSYVLAVGFAIHLALRGYWVGLIGLKAAFPEGIRWERASGIGPINRERLQRLLPSLDSSIARADRHASMLFAGTTLSALVIAWLALLGALVFVAGALFGSRSGSINQSINLGMEIFMLTLVGSVALLWLLDAVLARWIPALRKWRVFRWLVGALALVAGVFFPPRLIGPVRLTLQTNTRPLLFLMLAIPAVLFLPTLAVQQFQAARSFDRFNTHGFLHTRDLDAGLRSLYYESQRIPRQRSAAVPMIPAPVIDTAFLPLFLPYLPLRDDPLVRSRCPDREPLDRFARLPELDIAGRDARAHERSVATRDCLMRLWRVSLAGQPVDPGIFLPAERADLGHRGLLGYLDLRDLQPGLHELIVEYRPDPDSDEGEIEEQISGRTRHVIPFLWSPESAAEPRPPRGE